MYVLSLQGEPDLASGSDVNGSTESFEMVIEEAAIDSAAKLNSGKAIRITCSFRLVSEIQLFC